MTATPRSIFARSESPTRTAFIATLPVTNGSSILLIYERLFFHNDFSSDRHICSVPDHSRLGSYLPCFGLELSHQELNRFEYEKSALPQRFSVFQSKLIDRIPDVLWIHYLGRSVERVHQLQEPRLEHRKRLSQASFDEDPVL